MSHLLLILVIIVGALVLLGLALYLLFPRKYESARSVAESYDDWTNDGILEFYWGEHIHLGHYGSPPVVRTFAKQRQILSMKWCAGRVSIACRRGQRFWMWAVALAGAVVC